MMLNIIDNQKYDAKYVWSDVVSLCERFAPKKSYSVLELGCGNGTNSQYFLNKGCNYTGIDLKTKPLPHCKIIQDDYIKNPPTKHYDVILDRCSLHLNDKKDVTNLISKINYDYFFGIDCPLPLGFIRKLFPNIFYLERKEIISTGKNGRYFKGYNFVDKRRRD